MVYLTRLRNPTACKSVGGLEVVCLSERGQARIAVMQCCEIRITRFSELLAGVLNKGVWWMPRLKKAMKDVVQLR